MERSEKDPSRSLTIIKYLPGFLHYSSALVAFRPNDNTKLAFTFRYNVNFYNTPYHPVCFIFQILAVKADFFNRGTYSQISFLPGLRVCTR